MNARAPANAAATSRSPASITRPSPPSFAAKAATPHIANSLRKIPRHYDSHDQTRSGATNKAAKDDLALETTSRCSDITKVGPQHVRADGKIDLRHTKNDEQRYRLPP